MSVDKKILDRVEKLLRLAAPSSGTTDAERASAALEVAKLVSEHGLEVVKQEAPKRDGGRPRTPRPGAYPPPPWPTGSRSSGAYPPPRPPAPPGWAQSVAARDAACADPTCRGPIARGEPVWMRMNAFYVEYVHRDGACGW